MITIVVRIPIATAALGDAIRDLCDNQWAAGNRLGSAVLVADQMIFIFQPR